MNEEKEKKAMKFIPVEKQSKKAQKAAAAARRGSWNGVNPRPRIVESKKAYDRASFKREARNG